MRSFPRVEGENGLGRHGDPRQEVEVIEEPQESEGSKQRVLITPKGVPAEPEPQLAFVPSVSMAYFPYHMSLGRSVVGGTDCPPKSS